MAAVLAVLMVLALLVASWFVIRTDDRPPVARAGEKMRQTVLTRASVDAVTIGGVTRRVAGLDLADEVPAIRAVGADGREEAHPVLVHYVDTEPYRVSRATIGLRSGTAQEQVEVSGWVEALPLRYTRDGQLRMVVRTQERLWAEIEAPESPKRGRGTASLMRVRVVGAVIAGTITTSEGPLGIDAVDLAGHVPLVRPLAAGASAPRPTTVSGAQTVPLAVAEGTVGLLSGTPQVEVEVQGTVDALALRYLRDGVPRAIVLLADGRWAEIPVEAAPVVQRS